MRRYMPTYLLFALSSLINMSQVNPLGLRRLECAQVLTNRLYTRTSLQGHKTYVGISSVLQAAQRECSRCSATIRDDITKWSPTTQPAKLWGKTKSSGLQPSTSSSRSKGSPNNDDNEPDDDSKWGIFDLSRYNRKWQVPWGPGRVATVMVLWFSSFIVVGFVLVPHLYLSAGVSLYDLSPEDKAVFTLVCQSVETAVSLALMRVLTAGPIAASGASSPADLDLFVMDPRKPFRRPTGWAAWGLMGGVAAPAVVGITAALLSVVGWERLVEGGAGTVDGVTGLISLDTPTYLSLLAVTGVLAPVLEETVFRGFLLTSLTSFLPTWAAVGVSALAFGLAHLSLRDLPVLCALGVLLGTAYVRSRNLLTPMLIHGAWNGSVLSVLFWLTSEGVDVQKLISDMRDASG